MLKYKQPCFTVLGTITEDVDVTFPCIRSTYSIAWSLIRTLSMFIQCLYSYCSCDIMWMEGEPMLVVFHALCLSLEHAMLTQLFKGRFIPGQRALSGGNNIIHVL